MQNLHVAPPPPWDVSNVAVWSGHGLKLADVRVISRDSVVATVAQLTHHRLAMVRSERRVMLRDVHLQYGVCGQFLVPSTLFATHAGNTSVGRVLRAMGTLGVGLLMPSSVLQMFGVLVRTRPPAAGAMGRAEVGVQILHLQG